MCVVFHAQLIRPGKQQRIRFRDRFILFQLFNQLVWLCGIAASENGPRFLIQIANAVALIAA